MKKENKNKKNKKDIKTILRTVINIFCYVVTAIVGFVLIIYAFNGCSNTNNDNSVSVATSRQHRQENSLVYTGDFTDNMPFNAPVADYNQYGQVGTMIRTDYVAGDTLDTFVWDCNNEDLEVQLNSSNQSSYKYFGLYYDGMFLDYSNRFSTIYVSGSTGTITGVDINDDDTVIYRYSDFQTRFVIVVSNFDRIIIPDDNTRDFYESFTYICTYDGFMYENGESIPEFDTYLYNLTYWRYKNYIYKTGTFIMNPFYDFSGFAACMPYEINKIDMYNGTAYFGTEYYRIGRRLYTGLFDDGAGGTYAIGSNKFYRYPSDSPSLQFYNDDSMSYNTRYTIAGQIRFIDSDVLYFDKSQDPWFYYVDMWVINFTEYIPYQSSLENFDMMFIPFSTNTLKVSYEIEFDFIPQSLLNKYVSSSGANLNAIINYFRPSSQIYLDGDHSFKAFTVSKDFWTTAYYMDLLNYYPENAAFNTGDGVIYKLVVNTTATYERHVYTNGIDINDLMMFVLGGAHNPRYRAPVDIDNPSNTGGLPDNGTMLTGIIGTFDLLHLAVDGFTPFFNIEVSKGLTLGAFMFVPMAVFLLFTVIKLFKR